MAGSTDSRASLTWTVHPAAESPGRAVLVALILLVAAGLAARQTGSALFGVAGLVFLAVSLRAFFLPRTYALDELGAEERGPLTATRRLAWSAVRRIDTGRFGVHLSPRRTDSRLLPQHGLFLRTHGNRDEVTRFLEHVRTGDGASA